MKKYIPFSWKALGSIMKIANTPHVIHYCWFGHGELSEQAKKTLASWEKYAPDFEFRRCDESTFDVNYCEWSRRAYESKKYAFVADYARFRLVRDFGGVYMDLGSELLRDITQLVDECSPFSAIEELSKTVNAGLIMAAPPHDPLISSVVSHYESMPFYDDQIFLGANTVNEVFTSELEKFGFVRQDIEQKVRDWTLLQSSAFNPVYSFGGFHIKNDTYSVHHYSASWAEPKFRAKQQIELKLSPILGRRVAQIVGRFAGEVQQEGLMRGFHNCFQVAKEVINRRK